MSLHPSVITAGRNTFLTSCLVFLLSVCSSRACLGGGGEEMEKRDRERSIISPDTFNSYAKNKQVGPAYMPSLLESRDPVCCKIMDLFCSFVLLS